MVILHIFLLFYFSFTQFISQAVRMCAYYILTVNIMYIEKKSYGRSYLLPANI